jgi:hypothetical protein
MRNCSGAVLRLQPALFLAFCAAALLPAQTDVTATITGNVTDNSSAAVPGAKIEVFNLDKQTTLLNLTSDNSGNFVAPLLPVGKYRLTVEAPGFKKAVQENIVLNVKDNFTAKFVLQVGNVSETVSVQETATQVQLQSSEQSTTINGTQIRELALVTRNYAQLVALMPGVTSASVDQLYVGNSLPSGQTATIPFSINGTRNSGSGWTIDGADNVDRGSNLSLINTPSIDSIAEFKVQRGTYSAESGRAGGGQISVITKSGTNEFHGDIFEFVRNSAFSANNFYSNANRLNLGPDGKSQVAPLHYNNFGGTLGGPIWIPKIYNGKNKTFFFFSEEFRRVITYASGTATLPTSAEINGTFTRPVCGSYTGDACNQTTLQITRINPVAQAYIRDIYSKLPLSPTSNTLVSLFRNTYNFEQELYKLDHVFGDKLRVSVRYLRDSIPTTEPQGLFTTSPIPGVPTTSTNSPGHNWAGNATWTISPTLVNQIGFNYTFGAIVSDPTGLLNSSASPDINPNLPFPVTLGRVPSLTFNAGNSGTSLTGFGPYRDYNRNYNGYDNLTKILGPHSIRTGFTYNYYQKTENAAGNNVGSFDFTSPSIPAGATAFQQAFANFLIGHVATFSQASLDITPDIRQRQWEIYLQDDWKVRPNLTLNLGLRYSMFRQPFDARGFLTTFDSQTFNQGAAAALTPTGTLAPGTPRPYLNGISIGGRNSPFGSKVATQDMLNFAPRFGFAWDPFSSGKTSIRGGYGIFYDASLVGTLEQNIFANPPFVNSVSIPNTTLDNPAGGTAAVNANPVALRGTPSISPTPYTQQWSFGVQRQITASTVLNVSYVGTKGTHLLGIVDLNTVQPGLAYSSGVIAIAPNGILGSASTPLLNQLRPFRGYSSINIIEPWFNSNYNSLQIDGRKTFSGDNLVAFSYTWSKSLTDNQSDRSTAPQNVYNFNKGEYGLSQLDRRHVFSLNFVYTLPFFRDQKGIAGKALGGWEVSGIASYYTGLPLTVTTSGTDPGGLGIAIAASAASLRPDLVCDPNTGSNNRLAWFNTACFPAVPTGVRRPGNEGRGVLHGPGYEGWSLSGSKNFLFGAEGRFRFQLRGEASNVLNHANPNTVGVSATTTNTFGTITGYRDPRIVQLAGKFYF